LWLNRASTAPHRRRLGNHVRHDFGVSDDVRYASDSDRIVAPPRSAAVGKEPTWGQERVKPSPRSRIAAFEAVSKAKTIPIGPISLREHNDDRGGSRAQVRESSLI
jgi:hypothetical protein